MTPVTFLKPRLTGARFEGHAIPLEFLKDLAVIEEMIVEVAKQKFLEDNTGRKRTPRGFTDGIQLQLTGVEDGSAIPVISLLVTGAAGFFPPVNQVYFERARDAIVSGIAAAEQHESVTQYLPESTLGYFDRIGRSLRDGEAMEFSTDVRPEPARLTRESRRRLILASTRVREYTDDTTIRGMVPEADQGKDTFILQIAAGHRVDAPMSEPHRESILDAFIGYQDRARILVKGVGKYDRQSRLKGLESIEHVSNLDPLDVPARLDELRGLKDGWMEGRGRAPTAAGLDWLSTAFNERYSDGWTLPFLYPTPEGGIQAEWTIDDREASLEIDLATHQAEWHVVNMTDDTDESRELDLDTDAAWDWLGEQIGGSHDG